MRIYWIDSRDPDWAEQTLAQLRREKFSGWNLFQTHFVKKATERYRRIEEFTRIPNMFGESTLVLIRGIPFRTATFKRSAISTGVDPRRVFDARINELFKFVCAKSAVVIIAPARPKSEFFQAIQRQADAGKATILRPTGHDRSPSEL